MADSEPKEIVLGNKQLLSMFFIVAVLLGVAFTMGYMIGKNTGTVTASGSSIGLPVKGSARPPAAEPRTPVPELAVPERSVPESSTPEPKPTEPASHERKAVEKATQKSPHPAAEESANVGAPAHGSYLQLAALKREDADRLVTVLRKRGFPALLGESPKEGLFRVLVGPFKNMPDLAESKQKLRAAGFESIVAR